MSITPVTVVELRSFLRMAADIWDEADRADFVDFIARNPDIGDLIPGLGGIRKVRWRRPGMGRRVGARVVYYYHDLDMPLFLLLAYAKAWRGDMTPDEKKRVHDLASAIRQAYRRAE